MGKSKSGTRISHKSIKSVLISVLSGEVITMMCLFASAVLMAKAHLPLYLADTIVIVCAAVGALCAGFILGMLTKEKGLIYGAGCGGILCIIWLLFSAFANAFCGSTLIAVKLITVMLLSILGAILGVNKKAKRVKF